MQDQAKTPAGEQTREPAERRPAAARGSIGWTSDFVGTEHPETARLRIQKDYIETMIGLKREALDQSYAYLGELIAAAKEEMGHARSNSNEHRRAMLQQHVEELVAYLSGHGISAKLPNLNGDAKGAALAKFYVIDEIPAFLGEVKFLIDLWYSKNLATVHDEVAALIGLNRTRILPNPEAVKGGRSNFAEAA